MTTRQLSVLLAVCLILMTGCGQQVSAGQAEAESDVILTAETITGKIKEINGNEILLAIAEVEERSFEGLPDAEGESATTEEAPPKTEEQAPAGRQNAPGGDERPAEAGEGFSGGERPTGGQAANLDNGFPAGSFGGGGRQQGATGGRSGGMAGRSGGGNAASADTVRLTGEEKTYLIPVTATVTTGQGESSRAIRFTQLAIKNVIRMDLDEQGNILRVEVLQ